MLLRIDWQPVVDGQEESVHVDDHSDHNDEHIRLIAEVSCGQIRPVAKPVIIANTVTSTALFFRTKAVKVRLFRYS